MAGPTTTHFVGSELPSDRESMTESVLMRDEVERHLGAADHLQGLGDLVSLILHLGLRPDCERLQIQSEDIDLDWGGLLHIRSSKLRAGKHTLRLVAEACQILRPRILQAPWTLGLSCP